MIKPAKGKSRLIFALVSAGIILMAAFILLTANKKQYLLRLNNTLAMMAIRNGKMDHIDRAIQTLYDAENNFRIYTLTGDSSRSARYQKELGYITRLLDTLGRYDKNLNDLPGLLLDKKEKAALLLQAKLISDSLWDQSGKLIHVIQQPAANKPAAGHPAKVRSDTVIMVPPVTGASQHKGLLARVRDAIRNTPDTAPASRRIIITKSATGGNRPPALAPSGNRTAANGFWNAVYKQLAASRKSLSMHTLAMLHSNERLFGALKNSLAMIQDKETDIARKNRVFLQRLTQTSAGRIKRDYRWTVAIILLFTGMLLWALRHIYRYEQALLRSKREAEEQALLKSTFAATISHEIRGVMQTINASVEQLSHARALSVKKEALKAINGSWGMLLTLVNNVLDYSKTDRSRSSDHAVPFYPYKAIKEITDNISLYHRGKNKIALNADIAIAEDTMLTGNEGELKQVLFNLVHNAVKFTDRGHVSVEAAMAEKDAGTALLRVSVRDTGRGINKADLRRIFDEFFQSDPGLDHDAAKGSGLGLAIVKKIIERQQGKINVSSEPGKGSVFSFEIPYKSAGPEPPKSLHRDTARKSLQGTNMLIVEDSPIQKKYLHAVLSKEGVHVYMAGDGKEALNLLKHHAIDMVITDVNMPGMSGTALAEKIRNLADAGKASVPLIAMTGDVSEKDIEGYKQAGMHDHLVKPFTSEELILKIKSCMAVGQQAKTGKSKPGQPPLNA